MSKQMFASIRHLVRHSGGVPVLMLCACLAACAGLPRARTPTESDLSAIKEGMTRDEVLTRVGPPTWTFRVRQEDLTIWNYRYDRNSCLIYQVSVRPNGTVRDAGISQDPACDHDRDSWK
jgi:hypothetical protein